VPQTTISRAEGRELFGLDPHGYDHARPPYPEAVFDLLVDRCGLARGTATLEIGAGTGIATRRLVALGADPLVAIEPDSRLAAYLREQRLPIEVLEAPFESARVAPGGFQLAVCATAFHWIDAAIGLARVADALAIGGWWAAWWNVFGDATRADPFHEATKTLLEPLPMGPAGRNDAYPTDRAARLDDIARTRAFVQLSAHETRWTLVLEAARTRALYATYSSINRLATGERERVLDELERIARDEFGGRVERNMITAVYLARRI
jgi:SAM-dependent methyltransferase